MPDVDLSAIFQTVSAALAENQNAINQADSVNHDHGNDVVDIFNIISGAVQKKKTASTSAQLRYAGKQLEKKANSGTARVYADSLKKASVKYSDKELNPNSAIDFIQTLMGGAVPSTSPAVDGNDLLGSLVSGAVEGQMPGSSPSGDADVLGSLLAGMMGGQTDPTKSASTESPVTDLLSGLLGGDAQTGDGKFNVTRTRG